MRRRWERGAERGQVKGRKAVGRKNLEILLRSSPDRGREGHAWNLGNVGLRRMDAILFRDVQALLEDRQIAQDARHGPEALVLVVVALQDLIRLFPRSAVAQVHHLVGGGPFVEACGAMLVSLQEV